MSILEFASLVVADTLASIPYQISGPISKFAHFRCPRYSPCAGLSASGYVVEALHRVIAHRRATTTIAVRGGLWYLLGQR